MRWPLIRFFFRHSHTANNGNRLLKPTTALPQLNQPFELDLNSYLPTTLCDLLVRSHHDLKSSSRLQSTWPLRRSTTAGRRTTSLRSRRPPLLRRLQLPRKPRLPQRPRLPQNDLFRPQAQALLNLTRLTQLSNHVPRQEHSLGVVVPAVVVSLLGATPIQDSW